MSKLKQFNATVTEYLSYAAYRVFSDVLYLILAVVQMFNVLKTHRYKTKPCTPDCNTFQPSGGIHQTFKHA